MYQNHHVHKLHHGFRFHSMKMNTPGDHPLVIFHVVVHRLASFEPIINVDAKYIAKTWNMYKYNITISSDPWYTTCRQFLSILRDCPSSIVSPVFQDILGADVWETRTESHTFRISHKSHIMLMFCLNFNIVYLNNLTFSKPRVNGNKFYTKCSTFWITAIWRLIRNLKIRYILCRIQYFKMIPLHLYIQSVGGIRRHPIWIPNHRPSTSSGSLYFISNWMVLTMISIQHIYICIFGYEYNINQNFQIESNTSVSRYLEHDLGQIKSTTSSPQLAKNRTAIVSYKIAVRN